MTKVSLGELKPGSVGRVERITGESSIRRRLREMGVIAGQEIKVVRVAPLGDPIDIELKGYHLSLRRVEAERVLVEVES